MPRRKKQLIAAALLVVLVAQLVFASIIIFPNTYALGPPSIRIYQNWDLDTSKGFEKVTMDTSHYTPTFVLTRGASGSINITLTSGESTPVPLRIWYGGLHPYTGYWTPNANMSMLPNGITYTIEPYRSGNVTVTPNINTTAILRISATSDAEVRKYNLFLTVIAGGGLEDYGYPTVLTIVEGNAPNTNKNTTTTTGTLTVTSNTVLTADHYGSIVVAADNITLDGNGHTVTGRGSGNGVYLHGRTGVTVKNLRVSNFNVGIYLDRTNNSVISSNTVVNNRWIGINLFNSSVGNLVSGNNASWNDDRGMVFTYHSSNNTVKNNAVLNNRYGGIAVGQDANHVSLINNTASNNRMVGFEIVSYDGYDTLIGNTASSNQVGIQILGHSMILTNNTVSNNVEYGIYLQSDHNIVSGNNILNNTGYGLYIYRDTSYNKIYNNNFISKSSQAHDDVNNIGNVFHQPWPIGGNYWSSYHTPAQGCYNIAPVDGFCDAPYTIGGVTDYLPWVSMNGWTNKSLATLPTTTLSTTETSTIYINRTVTTTSTQISTLKTTLPTTITSTTATTLVERTAAEPSIIYPWAIGATAIVAILAIILLLRRRK